MAAATRLLVLRHGERIDMVNRDWCKSAARPWDPPLTALGHAQATAAGRALRRQVDGNALLFSSPLQRTVETSERIAAELGIDRIHVEPGLAEVMDEDWYEWWGCTPDHAAATMHGPDLFYTPEQLQQLVSPRVVLTHTAAWDWRGGSQRITMREPEREGDLAARLGRTAEALSSRFEGRDLVLVSHGTPIVALARELDGIDRPMVGFTAVCSFRRVPPQPAAPGLPGYPWKCEHYGDVSHLADVVPPVSAP